MKAEKIKALFKKFEEAAQEVEGIECWSVCNCGVVSIQELQRNSKLTLVSATSIIEGGA